MYNSTSATDISANSAEQVEQFLGALYVPDDLLMVRFIETWDDNGRKSHVKGTHYVTAGSLATPRTFDFMNSDADAKDANFFFGVCPRPRSQRVVKDEGGRRTYTHDHACQINTVRSLWVDIDDCGVEGAMFRCREAGLPAPTVVVSSGHGAHLYWRLADPIEIPDAYAGGLHKVWNERREAYDFFDEDGEQVLARNLLSATADRVQRTNHALAKMIGGDDTQDLARLLRIPGTMNRKNIRNGGEPTPCVLVECDRQRVYTLDEFPDVVAQPPAAKPKPKKAVVKTEGGQPVPLDLSILTKWEREQWAKLLANVVNSEVGQRSDADFALVAFAVSKGLDRDGVWAAVCDHSKFAERGEAYFDTTWDNAEKEDEAKHDWAEAMRLKYEPAEEVAVDPDDDTPDELPEDDRDPADFEDVEDVNPAASKKQSGNRQFVDANAILLLPDPAWLVEGLLVENALAMVYGLPGCYKTFFALDLALSLAHGLPFLDQFNVPQELPVAYITPEGTAGLKHRLRSWMAAKGIERLRNCQINRHAFMLNEADEVGIVIQEIMNSGIRPRLLVIDTLARNFGADENSTKDMSAFVNNVMQIGSDLNVAILLVHHAGKDTGKGARGSIALTGAADLSIEIVKPEGERVATVRCKKQKDAEEFKAFNVKANTYGSSLSLEYVGENKGTVGEDDVTTEHLGAILKVIPATGGLQVKEVVGLTNKPDATVRRYLGLGVSHGYLERVGERPVRYVRTPKVLPTKGANMVTNEG